MKRTDDLVLVEEGKKKGEFLLSPSLWNSFVGKLKGKRNHETEKGRPKGKQKGRNDGKNFVFVKIFILLIRFR